MCLPISNQVKIPVLPVTLPVRPVAQEAPVLPPQEVAAGLEPVDQLDGVLDEGLQREAGFLPTAAGATGLGGEAKQAGTSLLGQLEAGLEPLSARLQAAEAKLEFLTEQIPIVSTVKAEELLSELLNVQDQAAQHLTALESQLGAMRQGMARLGEAKLQEILAPVSDQLAAARERLQNIETRLQQALPAGLSLPQLKASVHLQNAVAEITAEISPQGLDAKASLKHETLTAWLQASSRTGVAGGVALEAGAFRALLEASSHDGGEGRLQVSNAALDLMLTAADGKVDARLQAQIDALRLSLEAGPQDATGRIEVAAEAFRLVLAGTTQGAGQARIEVDSAAFKAALQATGDGAVAGRVEVSGESLRAVAEVAYQQTLALKLGLSAEQIQVELSSDGSSVDWRLASASEGYSLGLSGSESQLSGMARIGEVGIEIGWHNTGIDVPEAYRQRMEALGGQPVQSEFYGVMVSFPF